MMELKGWEGRHSTEVAFTLLNQQPWVQISTGPIIWQQLNCSAKEIV